MFRDNKAAKAYCEAKRKEQDAANRAVDKIDDSGYRVTILDDFFPCPLSGFRYGEFTGYLKHFRNGKAYVAGPTWKHFCNIDQTVEEMASRYEFAHPDLAGKVRRFDWSGNLESDVVYLIFLSFTFHLLPVLERERVPFVFGLYPGGGFAPNHDESDSKLKKVFESPVFRKVLVTQVVTLRYLLENKFCKPEQIEFIYGGVTPDDNLGFEMKNKGVYGENKERLDICFVAAKYTPDGSDKGYDVFIESAKKLITQCDDVFFHVVGGFDEQVLDVSDLEGRIKFYGIRKPEWFHDFYKDADIIISPNLSFIRPPGDFDGFPTGCCADAMLHEVALFCTDPLDLNMHYTNGEDIVILPHEVDRFVDAVLHYRAHPDRLRKLACAGSRKTREVCSHENQMLPRIRLLKKVVADEKSMIRRFLRTIRSKKHFLYAIGPKMRLLKKAVKKTIQTTINIAMKSERLSYAILSSESVQSHIQREKERFLVEQADKIYTEKDMFARAESQRNGIDSKSRPSELSFFSRLPTAERESYLLACKKLHLGCGTRYLEGWTNIDNNSDRNIEKLDIDCDLSRPLPFESGAIDYIFHEHFIEHLGREEGLAFFKETYRVLRPGGVMRIACPDLEVAVDSYINDTWRSQEWVERFGGQWVESRCQMMNISINVYPWGHRYLYDREELVRRLALAGFSPDRVLPEKFGESRWEELRGLETRADSMIFDVQK